MATIFEVLLPFESSATEAEWAVDVLNLVPELERRLTIYEPASEISRLNAASADEPVQLSQDVFAVLQKAERFRHMTGGAFDITAGALVEIWGFTKRTGRKPERDEIEAALKSVGGQRLHLDPETRSATKQIDELQINLGAIGKGFAIDRVCQRLRMWGSDDFCVHSGHSSIAARGAMSADSEGWEIALLHPTQPKERLGRIRLRDQALGTSGSGQQFFHIGGQRYGHVIDPRTGWPAGHLLSLTVIAADATSADALATGLFVQGRDELERFAAENSDLGFIAVEGGRRAGDVAIAQYNVEGIWQPTSDRIVSR